MFCIDVFELSEDKSNAMIENVANDVLHDWKQWRLPLNKYVHNLFHDIKNFQAQMIQVKLAEQTMENGNINCIQTNDNSTDNNNNEKQIVKTEKKNQ